MPREVLGRHRPRGSATGGRVVVMRRPQGAMRYSPAMSAPAANPARTVRPRARRVQVAGGVGARGRLPRRAHLARRRAARRCPTARRRTCWRCSRIPSGEIHIGHVKNYTMGDVVAHFRRRNGVAVFHPMGYDSFGLPAENAAIRTGEPPARGDRARTSRASASSCGGWAFASTGDTEIATSDPEYYRWTQWLFLRLFERGLAERREAAVNWCPRGPDRAGQRAGHRRPLRALRHRGRAAPAHPVVLPHHRLRPAPARRHGRAGRLARARAHHAAQLDRPLRGRAGDLPRRGRRRGDPGLHHPPGHPLRGHLLHPGARAPAGRARWSHGRPEEAAGARLRRRRRAGVGRRPRRRRARPRPASSPAAT